MKNQRSRRDVLQLVCPSPARHLQQLVLTNDLRTGLDIGCGETSILSELRSADFRTSALDASEEAIEVSKTRSLHDEYLVGDIRSLELESNWDVVVLSQIIEHFDRDEGMQLLAKVENMARRIVYVATPNGFREQPALGGNTYQRHLSGWFPHDFEGRGYSVFGMSIKGLRGVAGSARLFPEPLTRAIERLTQWFSYRVPGIAGTIAAIRYVDEDGNVRRV